MSGNEAMGELEDSLRDWHRIIRTDGSDFRRKFMAEFSEGGNTPPRPPRGFDLTHRSENFFNFEFASGGLHFPPGYFSNQKELSPLSEGSTQKDPGKSRYEILLEGLE